jgi:hypothetical protein
LPLPSANNVGILSSSDECSNTFAPFPNENSFRLGNWYWNNGFQKSQDDFKNLLNIIGDEKFRPEDVRHTKWKDIDKALGRNDFDESSDISDEEWMDEDAGWKATPVYISVPFHRRMKSPGPKMYHVGDLYHRSLVSVIREKLRNPLDNQNFHHEGFELFWKPTDQSPDVRVHGELYTSPAFTEAQREVQDSLGEPGCNLPRVVLALMFWSDATHLTTFGNTKLWPAYLYFGNESKYRRCKPSSNLCNHIAYFQAASLLDLGWMLGLTILTAS